MDYRNNIADKILNLNFTQAGLFGLIVFRRLFPNYQIFNKMYGNEFDEDRLWEIHTQFEELLTRKHGEGHNSAVLGEEIFDLMPEPGDYDSILASSALDASSTLSALNDFLATKDNKRIVDISTMAFDTVDMYIQEEENLPARFDESIIDNDPLMIKEINFQQKLLEDIKEYGLNVLETYVNLPGSLELRIDEE
ncbi:MAG: DUF416 family protein [Crocinitomicaceae bacterium]|nr:DUF416 family protein [Crocinitomicaceae bacterium]